MKSKPIDNKPVVKVRLCACGFEEEQNYRNDRPMRSREGLRCAFSIIAWKKWPINSIDNRTIYLQGKNLERNVFARPPKKAQKNKIWKLSNCIYEFDAFRYWHLKVREELCKLGARSSQLDQGLFIFHNQTEIAVIFL